ncbi:hypothetical protein [Bordetella ansorpii]
MQGVHRPRDRRSPALGRACSHAPLTNCYHNLLREWVEV